ncbi:MAG TPA: GNAT family N-acetyltransferase [Candidatus Sulfotelmatobacter sp.]|nr:GNAT family N-acetyltransferase [Candidatus Sulfotelmatobacter sp.]
MVRRAKLDDADAIARVHVASWRTTYRGLLPDDFLASMTEARYADRWRRGIADSSTRVYVVEDATGPVGFASGGAERAGEDGFAGELYSLYVLEAAQRSGHGRELVRAIVGGLRELGFDDMIAWVLRDNSAARAFYERLGGSYVREQTTTIGPVLAHEVSYGWRRLDDVRY